MASKKKKAKAKPKTKAKTKPKAKAKKKKTTAKAKTTARKKAKKAGARKAKSQKTVVAKKQPSASIIIDEVLEEPLQDVSTVLRIKDRLARSGRDVDEDERKQFSDPSLVVEAQGELPSLFADEARRQKQRARDPESVTRPPSESSLFGLDDDDEDEG